MNYINEEVPLGDVEVWEVKNNMMMNHNFHIHATHFMLLERNGSSLNVKRNEKGYKDTVLIPGNESVKFIVKMTDYKDERVPYMYHCHFLEHEDAGMMGQFVVVT
jgi:FtsP/CotA-like multicopper oxidase with cupredoxin domain